MESELDWNLLAKYVAGECSSHEEAQVQAWTEQDPARLGRVEGLRRVWEAAGASPAHWDAEAAWKAFRQRAGSDMASHGAVPYRASERHDSEEGARRRTAQPARARCAEKKKKRRRPARRTRLFQAVAVALVVAAGALLLAVFLKGEFPLAPPESGGKVFATQEGQRATLRLTDGTEVRLNADSRLTLSEEFSTGARAVRLEGEAYFDVARDPARPFLVRTQEASVEVRGTAFNIEAYPGDAQTQVAVTEGEVDLRPSAPQPTDHDSVVRLKPRSLGVASERGLQPVQRGIDLSGRLAWTEGRLVFENAPPREVARKLERWYGLQVDVRVPARSAVVGLNATFEDEPLSEVLRSIAAALSLEYERRQDAVTFDR